MEFIFSSLSRKNILEWLKSRHVRELFFVFCIQAFSLIASLGISLIITNLLGAAAYGVFSYAFSWVNLLAVFSCMGMEQLALKELPPYSVQNLKGFIRGYFIYSTKRVLVVSILFSIALFTLSWLLNQPADESLRRGLWLAIPILPVIAMINLRFAWLRSFQFNSLSQFPDKVLRPAAFLVLLGIMWVIYAQGLNIWLVIVMSMVSILIAYLAGNYLVRTKVLKEVEGVTPSFERMRWMKVALSLFVVNGIYFYLSQIQILILGSFKGAEETGIYSIVSRLSDLEGYVLFALNVVMAPVISRLFAEGKMHELQSVISKSMWLAFIFSLPIILCFLLFPGFFLHLFGDEFASGSFALVILTISQIVNFATGSVGYLLTMTGHQKTAIQLLSLCALLTTTLSFLLIPTLGKNGAAIAAGVNNILLNVLMAIAVYRKTGLNSTLLRIK